MSEKNYNLKDPESKTRFHREIAQKLCGFSEEVERENYIEAVAEKYHIGFDNLRKLVAACAVQTGMAAMAVRPKSGIQKKTDAEENKKKPQKLLLTWLAEEPSLYPQIKKYISSKDFTSDLYRKIAEKFFEDLENGAFHPADIISMFTDEQQQREAAGVFNTKLVELSTKAEKEKAFHDILVAVKRESLNYFTEQASADMLMLNQMIAGKKELEELSKTHISLD